jgi:hypothetical protein
MAFIIGGHPRSGTTMLFRLCRDHPQIGITGEFKCFRKLETRFPTYVTGLEKKWREKSFIGRLDRYPPWPYRVRSGWFLARFWLLMRLRIWRRPVRVADVEAVLRTLTGKAVVGDKYPRYVFWLKRLSSFPDLKRIMIARDGRDVVSSFLRKVRTRWRNLPVARSENTARRIAERWVEAEENIERYRNSLFVVRYEEFVRDPIPALRGMAEYLGVDPAGFRRTDIRSDSVGNFRSGLTPDEMRDVMEIAGATLDRLGYL